MGGHSSFWDVYRHIEHVLLPGAKITTNDIWVLCRGERCTIRYCRTIQYGAIANHGRNIMKILIETGYVVKIRRGVWYVKMMPDFKDK